VKKSKKLLYILIIFSTLLVLPYLLRNYIYYGDPISPLLSDYLSDTEPTLSYFKESLKVGYSFNVINILKIPFTQGIITLSPSMITTIIGFGGLAILMAVRSSNKKSKLLITSFFISFCVIAFFGRPTSRFMFDIYLLGGAALVLSEFELYKKITINILLLQSTGVLLLSLYSVYALFPGALSNEYRDHVLYYNAHGYSASKVLKKRLPPNSVLLTDIRSKSLLPGKVILADAFEYAESVGEVNRIILSENSKNKITHVALGGFKKELYHSILECSDKSTEKFIEVLRATRNPLNRQSSQFLFFKVNDHPDCFLNL
jgi:hypothetical protein